MLCQLRQAFSELSSASVAELPNGLTRWFFGSSAPCFPPPYLNLQSKQAGIAAFTAGEG